ncbi:MAG: efflux RND transporter permease subunit, partial [Sphingomonadaceae bacterium]
EHGEGRAMDAYLRILGWTLDQTESIRLRSLLHPVAGRWWYYIIFMLVIVLVGVVAVITGQAVVGLANNIGLPTILTYLIAPLVAVLAGYVVARILWALFGAFGHLGEWYRYMAGRVSARIRDHRFYAFCIGLYALVLTAGLLASMPQQFDPESNEDTSRVNVEMVPGTTLEQTAEVTHQISQILLAEPDVIRTLESVREGNAAIYTGLTPADDRKETSREFERRLAPQFLKIADARVTFASQSGGFGSGRDITVMLSSSDPELLDNSARELVKQMEGVKGVVAPRIAADLQRPELHIEPRLDLASDLGVSTASLSQAIRIATMGEIDQNAAKYSLTDRQIPIRVMLDKASRRDISVIENLPVPTASGGSVPLKRVANITFGAGPTQIQRYNLSRRVLIGADLAEGEVKGPVVTRINELPIMMNLPQGVTTEPVGEDQWQAEMIETFGIAVITGIFLVFAVLVLLYRRFVSPLVNMTSLLLAPLGGLLALVLIGEPISMPVYIGMLMLLGIVAKNSILLIDFALEEMDHGVAKLAAIMDAGHKRAQPIVMTTVAMTAGMVPTALSLSGDGAWRAPMGITVIGGLLLSTLLTLLIVPAGFSLADGFEKRIGPWLRKTFLTYDPQQESSGRPETLPDTPGAAAPAE